MAERFMNLIGADWAPAASGREFESINPADHDEVVGVFPRSGAEDVERAVQAARKAFRGWRATPPPRRGEIVLRAAELLKQRKEDLARVMTREMGKVLKEARGDVQEAIDMGQFAAGIGRRPFGETVPFELPDKVAFTFREPVGVAGLITTGHFQAAILDWNMYHA